MANFSEILPGIVHIQTKGSSCFLVRGEKKDILVDTGTTGTEAALVKALRQLDALDRISLIFLTHAHHDHCMNIAAIKGRTQAKVAIFQKDADSLRAGKNAKGKATNFFVMLLRPFIRSPKLTWRFDPDILLSDFQDISSFGVEGMAVALPGHSRGSGGLLVGDVLIAGDHLMHFRGDKPRKPILMQDKEDWIQSCEKAKGVASKVLIAHGGPLFDCDVFNAYIKDD